MMTEMQPSNTWLEVIDLGSMPYLEALEVQRSRHADILESRQDGQKKGFLLLLEHDPPVVTVSRRPGAAGNVLAGEAALARVGIQRVETDRGGDVTYHGPGQLVAYPIVDLNGLGLRIHGYVRLLEQAAIDTCGAFGLSAERDPGATGVWVDRPPDAEDGSGGRKIAAIGVRVSRWIAMHGLSLNVDPDMTHYQHIVPCGLHERGVSSLARELDAPPGMAEVKGVFEACFRRLVDDPAAFRRRD
ncbi:MAG: lipoyl(octanoyl) transferase LipB [Phycisphaerales bacterium]|nr:lipoyl(octanoyl) transferase LipB [Phycisphaerales bacterium]